jgi:DNA-binding transcriptional regulator GbsR (MarR family)
MTDVESSDLVKLQEEFSNFLEDFMHDMGENPSLGRLYAQFIFFKGDYYYQSDLADKLNVTVSTISRNLKKLEDWSLVDRRLAKKTRTRKRSDVYQYRSKEHSELAFIDVVIKTFNNTYELITEKFDALERINDRYKNLDGTSKENIVAINLLEVLNKLLAFLEIFNEEYQEFLLKIEERLKKANLVH